MTDIINAGGGASMEGVDAPLGGKVEEGGLNKQALEIIVKQNGGKFYQSISVKDIIIIAQEQSIIFLFVLLR